MTGYKTNLKELFYFVQDDVVYEIKINNDQDKCGKSYLAEIGENKTTMDNELNFTEGKFPCIKVTYETVNGKTEYLYCWFQNLITDGCKYTGTEFKPVVHGEEKTFGDILKEEMEYTINSMAFNGFPISKIKSTLPFYCTVKENEKANINGKSVTVKSYETCGGLEIPTVDDDTLDGMIKDKLIEKVEAYGKKLADQYGYTFDKGTMKF